MTIVNIEVGEVILWKAIGKTSWKTSELGSERMQVVLREVWELQCLVRVSSWEQKLSEKCTWYTHEAEYSFEQKLGHMWELF